MKAAPTTCSLTSDDAAMRQSRYDDESVLVMDPRDTLVDLMTAIACSPEPSKGAGADSATTMTSTTNTTNTTSTMPRWDRKSKPERLDLVERRYGITKEERDHLYNDGLVVSSRLEYADYGAALQDVHRSQLPLYFSVDALFHAIYMGHDRYLAEVESLEFSGRLRTLLENMHRRLEANRARYRPDTLNDLDIYLAVARSLLGMGDNEFGASADGTASTGFTGFTGHSKDVTRLVGTVTRAGGLEMVEMFGRTRTIDTGQFRPRGHYASAAAKKNPYGADLSHYFRAAMWLSRIEFNLVTRSSQSSSPVKDTSETPHEATMAMALAELARDAGALDDLKGLDQAWAILAGAREDVSVTNMIDLMDRAKITDATATDAPEKLRSAIGNGFTRTARTHYQAQGSDNLPVIATLLGPRITNDAQATRPVVHPSVFERKQLPAVEMAYLLGHDRALAHLGPALTAFPQLRPQLDLAREVTFGTKTIDGKPIAKTSTTTAPSDLYSGWLGAIRGLSESPSGTRPTFMESDAYKDLRVSSAVAAYGQIRHNYVLIVPTTYEEGGCEIPDAYVEPAPAVYSALIEYAKRGQKAAAAFGPSPSSLGGYFERLENVLRVLSRIGDRELLGQPLRDEEKRFLAMVIEDTHYRASGYGPSTPLYNGWYYEMFRDAQEAHDSAHMVADYFASVQSQTVEYAGVTSVRMGFFVVDTNGQPRIAVGPVARSFQSTGPMAPRFSDDEIGRMTLQDPWAKSYTASPPTAPTFTIRPAKAKPDDPDQGYDASEYRFDVTSSGDAGPVTLSLLDHHGQPVVTETKDVKGAPGRPAKVRFVLRPTLTESQKAFGIEGLHVSAGKDFHYIANEARTSAFLLDSTARWEIGPGGPSGGKRIGGMEYTYATKTVGKRGRY